MVKEKINEVFELHFYATLWDIITNFKNYNNFRQIVYHVIPIY